VAGVITVQTSGQPGKDDGSFSIRGQNSFGDNKALVLVDGVPRDWNRIDPNEIANFVVLKDAASTAIYGVRGANGVVLITTKRGEAGKTKLNYSSKFSMQEATNYPELMNAYEYAKYINQGMTNDGDTDLPFTDEEIEKYRIAADGYKGTDWWKETLQDFSPMQQHSVSISGGSEKIKYFLSGNYVDQDGMFKNSNYDKYSLRSNIDFLATEDIKLSVDLAYSESGVKESGSGTQLWSKIKQSNPTLPAYANKEGVVKNGYSDNGNGQNPIAEAEASGYYSKKTNYLTSNLVLDWDLPIQGLKFKSRFSYDKRYKNNTVFTKPFEIWTYDSDNDTYTSKSGSLTELKKFRYEHTTKQFLSQMGYNKTVNGHNFDITAVFEAEEILNESLSASRQGFISDDVDQLFAGSDENKDNYGDATEKARMGYGGRLNYNYKGRYLVQLNARYDGSYNFYDEGKWGFFPGASLGWRISDEPFMKSLDFLSNLKLRASVGQTGNDNIDPYQYLSVYEFSDSPYLVNGVPYSALTPGVMANKNVTWEKATDYNFGLDFAVFKNKLSGVFELFYKNTEDILISKSASVPGTFGASLPDENIAEVDSKGIDLTLNYSDEYGDFYWNLGGTFTFARNEVVYMAEAENVREDMKQTGKPFGQKFGYVSLGLFQNQDEIDAWAIQDGNDNNTIQPGDIKYKDVSGPDDKPDGVIDGYDKTHIGKSTTPEIVYGINTQFGYKDFEIICNFQGADNVEKHIQYSTFKNGQNSYAMLADSWSEDNRGAEFPRLTATGILQNSEKISTFWLRDASYIRLKNLSVSYTFDSNSFVKMFKAERLRISLTGTNLYTWSDIDYMDPEGPESTQPFYPVMRTFTFGINLQF
jgi:TonB-linked SusC/RagA family outer membrane protein